jgi:hypothetical protein
LLFDKGAPGEPPRIGSALIPDVNFKADEYVEEPSPRDFFYLARRRTL